MFGWLFGLVCDARVGCAVEHEHEPDGPPGVAVPGCKRRRPVWMVMGLVPATIDRAPQTAGKRWYGSPLGRRVGVGMEGTLVVRRRRRRGGSVTTHGAALIILGVLSAACTRIPAPDDGLRVETSVASADTALEQREAELRRQLVAEPGSAVARARLARLLEQAGRHDEALAEFGELRERHPDSPDSYLGPFRIYIRQGQQRLAHRALEQFQERFPGDQAAVLVALTEVEAQQHAQAGRYGAAIQSYRDAIALAPREPHLWNALGTTYLANDQLPEALQAFKEAAKENPQDAEARAGQSAVLARMAAPLELPQVTTAPEPVRAAAVAPRAAHGDIASARSHLAPGGSTTHPGITEESLPERSARTHSPCCEPRRGTKIQGSSAEASIANDPQALRSRANDPQALRSRADDPHALRSRALAYEETENWEDAAALYRRLDALPGQSVDARTWRRVTTGRDLARAGRLVAAERRDEARVILADVRRRHPENPEAWITLAELSLATGEATQAWHDANQGLGLDPSAPRLHAVSIRALTQLRRFEDARLAITRAREHLGEPLVAALIVEVERAQGRPSRWPYARHDGDHDAKADRLAAAASDHLRRQEYREARALLEQAHVLAPQERRIRRELAMARHGAGAWRAALSLLEAEFAADGDAEIGVLLAETYHRLDRDDDAAAVLEQIEFSGDESAAMAQSTPVAPRLEMREPASDGILPELRLPHGPVRARSTKPNAPPPSSWREGRSDIEVAEVGAMHAGAVSMNDAAPPHAALFAGGALSQWQSNLARGTDRDRRFDAPHLAQAGSYDRAADDRDGWQHPRSVRSPARRAAPVASDRATVADDDDIDDDGASSTYLAVERRHDPTSLGVPSHADPAALIYDDPASVGADGDADRAARGQVARQRAQRLARDLQRRRAPKLGMSFRYDFLSSVSDWQADELSLFRFPVFIDVPAGPTTRFRLTGEPTFLDNGRTSDAGVAGMATVTGLPLGTSAVIASAGIGSTPAGFPRRPYVTGFAEIDVRATEALVLTPFFERQPVLESMLSFRGRELVKGDKQTFIGKVIQDRGGARVGFDTPVHLNGIVEIGYSTLQGIRIPRNEKVDAFLGIGRTFELRGYENQLRPGFDLSFFHYRRDLGAPLRDATLDDPNAIRDAVAARQTGGGYFSPDAFAQALTRLDFSGPFFPQTFGASSFLITGKFGGQWISGVDSQVFRNTRGGRLAGGVEAALHLPIEEIAAISLNGGALWADPYNRHFALVNIVFPLSFE